MAIKSSLSNMVLVLTLVCLGASAAVAVIYAVTKDPINAAEVAKKNRDNIADKIFPKTEWETPKEKGTF